jgi:hypothetical protein
MSRNLGQCVCGGVCAPALHGQNGVGQRGEHLGGLLQLNQIPKDSKHAALRRQHRSSSGSGPPATCVRPMRDKGYNEHIKLVPEARDELAEPVRVEVDAELGREVA